MDIGHIAKLAKLVLRDDEKEMLSKQFAGILEQFEVLDTLEASSAVADSTPPVANLRKDEVVIVEPKKQDALLDQSKYRDGRFLRLPSVFE